MKTKRIIPILFILILSLFPALPFGESAGYGEENENLGQFTDDFENDDNVSVAVDVINNQTLDCMELNYTGIFFEVYENFTEYTEIDIIADRIQITDQHIDHEQQRDETTYSYRDAGIGYFTDFEHWIDVKVISAQSNAVATSWIVSNIINEAEYLWTNDVQAIIAYFYHSTGNPHWRLLDCEGSVLGNTITIVLNTMYYFKIVKSGTGVILTIYPTAQDRIDNTNNIGTSSITLGTDRSYRYIFAGSSWDDATNLIAVVDIENLWFGDWIGGYETDGYFITEDYLNYTTGNTLALLTNASIPSGTSMTVQFSNDNATWIDNEGNVGSTSVLDGFYAIDLRDLNYTDSFKMYNLTTTISDTPRLFQSRLVTTNGTAGAGPGPTVIQNVTGEWIEYNLTEIDVLIGVHDSGDVNSTLDIDGDIYNCSEVVGAPGYRISFNWTNVDTNAHCLWFVSYVYYDGNQAHDIHIELYNFSSLSWIEIGTINDGVAFEWYNVSIYDLRIPNDFINAAGEVRGRFDHVAAGNINHDIHIEYLKLQAFIPFEDEAITEENFFWIFIAIVLSILTALLVWMKFGDNNN